jgi:hypothetical protein
MDTPVAAAAVNNALICTTLSWRSIETVCCEPVGFLVHSFCLRVAARFSAGQQSCNKENTEYCHFNHQPHQNDAARTP